MRLGNRSRPSGNCGRRAETGILVSEEPGEIPDEDRATVRSDSSSYDHSAARHTRCLVTAYYLDSTATGEVNETEIERVRGTQVVRYVHETASECAGGHQEGCFGSRVQSMSPIARKLGLTRL